VASMSKAFHLLFHSEWNGQTAVTAFSYGNTVNHLSYEFYFFPEYQKGEKNASRSTVQHKAEIQHRNCVQAL